MDNCLNICPLSTCLFHHHIYHNTFLPSFWHIWLTLLELADGVQIYPKVAYTKCQLEWMNMKIREKKNHRSSGFLMFAYPFKKTCLSSPPLSTPSSSGIQSGNFQKLLLGVDSELSWTLASLFDTAFKSVTNINTHFITFIYLFCEQLSHLRSFTFNKQKNGLFVFSLHYCKTEMLRYIHIRY